MLETIEPDSKMLQAVKTMLFIYFFMATLLTQIIMFNTLIAIFGETYNKITEKKEMYAIIQRAEIYTDFMHAIKR